MDKNRREIARKLRRHALLVQNPVFSSTEAMLENEVKLNDVADAFQPEVIVPLAAQTGVRYSLENPCTYIDSNVMKAARRLKTRHLLMASTSSVHGANEDMPFSETERADTQLTIYAATKKANESMAYAYAQLWNLPTTMFQFLTIYGPWGRPDLALFKFVAPFSMTGQSTSTIMAVCIVATPMSTTSCAAFAS